MNSEMAKEDRNVLAKLRHLYGPDSIVARKRISVGNGVTHVMHQSMFPMAETLAYLWEGGERDRDSAARLARFMRQVLGQRRTEYAKMASLICHMFRHAFAHGDEAFILEIEADPLEQSRRQGKLQLEGVTTSASPEKHLQVSWGNDDLGRRVKQLCFCRNTFYEDLLHVLMDDHFWDYLEPGELQDRYVRSRIKLLKSSSNGEVGQAAREMAALWANPLPAPPEHGMGVIYCRTQDFPDDLQRG